MISREELFVYAKEKYNIEPDYPWVKTPNNAVLRHRTNRKWFGTIVDVTADKLGLDSNDRIDALLLKCDPNLIGSLRSESGILPAYHMNKEHWITVLLDGSIQKERIYELLDLSYCLTK